MVESKSKTIPIMQFIGNIEQVFAEKEIKGKDNKSLTKREFLLTIESSLNQYV